MRDLPLNALLNVLLIGGAFGVFAVIHSLTAGSRFKRYLARHLGHTAVAAWYRLAYNLFSAVSIAPALALSAALPDKMLYQVSYPWSLVLAVVQVCGLVGGGVALLSTDLWRFAGITQVIDHLAGKPGSDSDVPLQTGGLYRFVRHPLYLFSLMIIWPLPVMTCNTLIFNIAATLYFGVGSIIEERRLERHYGDSYRQYRQQVPWLLPRLWR